MKDKNEYLKSKSISMGQFLFNYCGMPEVIDFENAKHKILTNKELEKIDPSKSGLIIRYSLEYIYRNLEKVETGEIIIVRDEENNIAPYQNPLYINTKKLLGTLKDREKVLKEMEKNKEQEDINESCENIKIPNKPKREKIKRYRKRVRI